MGVPAALLDRLRTRFSESDVTYLDSRLHIDAQLYGEHELQAARDGIESTLRAEPGIPWSSSVGCRLSDMRRVEIGVYNTATPEQIQRVRALAEPYGDRLRVELLPYGPPTPGVGLPISLPPRPAPVAVARHVKMAISRRCVRGRAVRIAARPSQPAVQALTVRAGGRSRTIAGRRLAKPLTVALKSRRTRVVVTVQLADGLGGTATVTYNRCR